MANAMLWTFFLPPMPGIISRRSIPPCRTAGAVSGTGTIAENLQSDISGELHEAEQRYPVSLHAVQLQDEAGVKRSCRSALEADKIYVDLVKSARVP